MNLILKQILIISVCFIIILWFQNKEDIKNKKERKSFYDKYKFPVLVSSIIGLILNLQNILGIDELVEYDANNLNTNTITEIAIIAPIKNVTENNIASMARPFIQPINSRFPRFPNSKDLTEQLVFTELPDF